MTDTNVTDFIGEMGAGIVEKKIANLISSTALGTVLYAKGRQTGKVGIEFTFHKVGDNDQVTVSTKLTQVVPTTRGKTSMEDTTDTPMFVGKGGVTTATAPREENNGQFNLVTGINDKKGQ